jgi:hypothetical protein
VGQAKLDAKDAEGTACVDRITTEAPKLATDRKRPAADRRAAPTAAMPCRRLPSRATDRRAAPTAAMPRRRLPSRAADRKRRPPAAGPCRRPPGRAEIRCRRSRAVPSVTCGISVKALRGTPTAADHSDVSK